MKSVTLRKSFALYAVATASIATSLLSGCGSPASATNSTTNSAAGSNSASQSQPSGNLTIYGALTKANGEAMAKAFKAFDPNANITMITAGTGPLITRIEAEHQAGAVHADVLLLADPTVMPQLDQQGILSSYKPAAAKNLSSSLQGKGWVGAFTFNNVIIYHKGMTTPIPQSWTDLKSSTYSHQVEIANPAYSGTTLGMVGYLSSTYGWGYFQSLRQNGATAVSSTNTVGTDVAAGRANIGISLDVVANGLIKKGSPIGIVWPKDGAIPVPAPVSIVTGKDNALSEAFVNWLVSPAGQQEVSKLGYAPASGPSNLVPSSATMANVDWTQVRAQRDTTLNQFKTIFGQ